MKTFVVTFEGITQGGESVGQIKRVEADGYEVNNGVVIFFRWTIGGIKEKEYTLAVHRLIDIDEWFP